MSPKFGRNSQPSNNGASGFQPSTQPEVEEALHFARKREQLVWGSGDEHEKARAEVERLEKLLPGTPKAEGHPVGVGLVQTAASASMDLPVVLEAHEPVADLLAEFASVDVEVARAALRRQEVMKEWSGTIEHIDIGIAPSGRPCVCFWLEPEGARQPARTIGAYDQLALWAKNTLQSLPDSLKGLVIEADGPSSQNNSGRGGDLHATFLRIAGHSSFVQPPFSEVFPVDDSWCDAPWLAPGENWDPCLRRSTKIEGTSHTESGLRLMGKDAIPILVELAASPNYSTRRKADDLFVAMGQDSLGPLASLAGGQDANSRDTAERALEKLLPASLGTLKELAKSSNGSTVELAQRLIRNYTSPDDLPY